MKARILIINPWLTSRPPICPLLVVDNQGTIVLEDNGLAFPLERNHLSSVTVEDIRKQLHIPMSDNVPIWLSPERELPPYEPLSPEMLQWMQEWWLEEAALLPVLEPLARAS